MVKNSTMVEPFSTGVETHRKIRWRMRAQVQLDVWIGVFGWDDTFGR
jgi:hypothetical protein